MKPSEREVMRLLIDSKELEMMRREVANLSWRNSELERQVVALRSGLKNLLHSRRHVFQDVSKYTLLLDQTDIEVCACGHMLSDHDDKGCNWLHCKSICGTSDK